MIGLDDLASKMEDAIKTAFKAAAKEIVELQISSIEQGRAIGGGAQKENEERTLRRKQKRNQGTTPLIATGRLADPSSWSIRRRGDSYRIKPPRNRKDVIYYLQKQGYKTIFNDFPQEKVVEIIEKHLEIEFKKAGII